MYKRQSQHTGQSIFCTVHSAMVNTLVSLFHVLSTLPQSTHWSVYFLYCPPCRRRHTGQSIFVYCPSSSIDWSVYFPYCPFCHGQHTGQSSSCNVHSAIVNTLVGPFPVLFTLPSSTHWSVYFLYCPLGHRQHTGQSISCTVHSAIVNTPVSLFPLLSTIINTLVSLFPLLSTLP